MSKRLRKGSRCPACTIGRLIPIEYGYPGPGMLERYNREEISLGGCVVSEVFDEERGEIVSANPQLSCPACGSEFFRDGRRAVAESI
jgi:DNA-directed RNA polymerase subunit RPC12/RpoP